MKLQADGYEFDFANALALYKFDDTDKASTHYHGLSHCPMKGVDVVAVFQEFELWIEIKDYPQMRLEQIRQGEKGKSGQSIRKEIQDALRIKFRDTFLYRWCEGLDRKVFYVCLTNFNDAECRVFNDTMKRTIPAGRKGPRWLRELIAEEHCFVVDLAAWNRNFIEKIGSCTKL
ncbi:MAG: hypothetical protein HUK17_06885 [Bacteroidales bacterium]|nr:hypothetical protein [Bacteroidales bacterium]